MHVVHSHTKLPHTDNRFKDIEGQPQLHGKFEDSRHHKRFGLPKFSHAVASPPWFNSQLSSEGEKMGFFFLTFEAFPRLDNAGAT